MTGLLRSLSKGLPEWIKGHLQRDVDWRDSSTLPPALLRELPSETSTQEKPGFLTPLQSRVSVTPQLNLKGLLRDPHCSCFFLANEILVTSEMSRLGLHKIKTVNHGSRELRERSLATPFTATEGSRERPRNLKPAGLRVGKDKGCVCSSFPCASLPLQHSYM